MPQRTSEEVSDSIGDIFAAAVEIVDAAAALVGNVAEHVQGLVADALADAQDVGREVEGLWDAAGAGIERAAVTLSAAPRFARVAGELLRIVGAYRWHAASAAFLDRSAAAATLDALHARHARRLRELCVELRGGVLKLGQFASSRMDLLPDAYVAELSLLQDRVPPVPTDAIIERIAAALGTPLDSAFRQFDAEPLAAASLAQVHAAELTAGTAVAVKVQVPGIGPIVEADLAALRLVAPALDDLLPFDLDTIAGELSRSVRAELDYVAEARHATAFALDFAGDPDVIVPAVVAELSSEEVLVLERIVGERLTDFLDDCERRGEAGAADRDRLFAILIRCFCTQVLEHGRLHADPHPGNFLVVAGEHGPRLALLDFGCVQLFAPERRRAYAALALAILSADAERLAELFAAMGFRSRSGDTAALRAFADLMLDAFRADTATPVDALDPRAAFERMLHLTRDNPVVAIPGDFVLLGRVFAVLGGLLMRYRPKVNLFQIIMPHLAR